MSIRTEAEGENAPPPGRLARRQARTRATLLRSAYDVMSRIGIDAATIKDITDHADLGFGTFYNYFAGKDDLAARILDCVIHDLGRRNQIATAKLRRKDPLLAVPISTRLVILDATTNPIWRWWSTRTDLLVDRVREGLLPFAKADILEGVAAGQLNIPSDNVDAAWSLAVWLLVGGIHDIQLGLRAPDSDGFVVASIMRMLGVSYEEAERVSRTRLPKYPPPSIDWSFRLSE